MTTTVPRHRTAMVRTALSRPLCGALDDGILDGATVFDFGCGRGDDLRRLTALGIACDGWDPSHRSHTERRPADVVNLGYVVNVIEDPAERQQVLQDAWALAQRVLIVSARLTWDARGLHGRAIGDGIVTGTGTFQKFYTQQELRAWIEQTLQAPTLAAGPGIMYVFRDPTAAQALLVDRVRRSSQPPEPWVSEQLYYEHQGLLAPLIDFLMQRGRMPRGDELSHTDAIRRRFGSLARAHAVIAAATGAERWEQLRKRHAANLLVYLALALFDGRPRFRDLPLAIQNDVREFFRNYKDSGVSQFWVVGWRWV
jgi:DNA phosphorothioation-associated putative methyltransferase